MTRPHGRDRDLGAMLAMIPARPLIVRDPLVRFVLEPGDRVLVAPGDPVSPGTPIAERTLDGGLVEAGRLAAVDEREEHEHQPSEGAPATLNRTRAHPGKWWLGGSERRSRGRDGTTPPLAGTLLYEVNGRWQAFAGESHRVLESPVSGVVREALNAVGLTIAVPGVALPGALAAGQPSRGRLDVPRLPDGELWTSALDVSRAGGVVVSGSRISAQAIGRARAMSIRGLVAASAGSAELRDLQASEARQRAGLAPSPPFGLLVLDGHQRRPIASPILALLSAAAGMEVAILTDPPLLVFDGEPAVPDVPADWIRVRGGPESGREGRLSGYAGPWRFRSGVTLDAAFVRLEGDAADTAVALPDLERFAVQPIL
jgi:hypothetical protein